MGCKKVNTVYEPSATSGYSRHLPQTQSAAFGGVRLDPEECVIKSAERENILKDLQDSIDSRVATKIIRQTHNLIEGLLPHVAKHGHLLLDGYYEDDIVGVVTLLSKKTSKKRFARFECRGESTYDLLLMDDDGSSNFKVIASTEFASNISSWVLETN